MATKVWDEADEQTPGYIYPPWVTRFFIFHRGLFILSLNAYQVAFEWGGGIAAPGVQSTLYTYSWCESWPGSTLDGRVTTLHGSIIPRDSTFYKLPMLNGPSRQSTSCFLPSLLPT